MTEDDCSSNFKKVASNIANKLLGFERRKKETGKDKTRWCLLLGQYCYYKCPHHYYRDFNGCCRGK